MSTEFAVVARVNVHHGENEEDSYVQILLVYDKGCYGKMVFGTAISPVSEGQEIKVELSSLGRLNVPGLGYAARVRC